MKIGYVNQTFKFPADKQIELLLSYGCEDIHIFDFNIDKDKIFDNFQLNDIIVVTNFVVLASSIQELLKLFALLKTKCITIHSIEPPFQSNMEYDFEYMLLLMGNLLDQFKYQKQQIGLQKVKLQGKKLGRKPKLTTKTIEKCIEYKKFYTSKEIANRFGVSKSTLLRHIAIYRNTYDITSNNKNIKL